MTDATIATESVTGNSVQTLYADGVYGETNMAFVKKHGMDFITTGVQGKTGRFDFEMTGKAHQVTNKKTGEGIPVEKQEVK